MKKSILLVICLCLIVMLQAQVSKTVNVTAGGLSSSLITKELKMNAATAAPTAVVKKASVAPVIDGVIDAVWATANTYNIDLQMGAPTLGNPGTTTWKALYTNDGIYVLVQVNDNVFLPGYAGASPGEPWMYDRLEIYFDVNSVLVDGLGAKNFNSGHYQIAPEFVEAQINGIPVTAGDGVVNAFRVTNPAYVGEYFIPFTKLIDKDGVEVPKNATIGFDVTVLDRDSEASDRPSANWSNNNTIGGSWDNMDGCGTIVLEGISVSEIAVSAAGGTTTIETDNGTLQMTASILPVDATHQNLNWTVENGTGKAKISSTGLLSALMNGVVNVKAEAIDGSGIFGNATITISGQVVQMSEINLIKNGNFNNVTSGFPDLWSFYSNSGDPKPTVDGGVVVCYPKATNPNPYDYQLYQLDLKALPNIPYTFSFTASADANRSIIVRFEDIANGYQPYGISSDPEAGSGQSDWLVNLTTVPTTYTFHVVFNQIKGNTIQRVLFNLNATSDKVYIDDVSLASAEELTGVKLSATSAILGAAEGSSATVDMITTANWTANSDQNWLAVSPASGTGNQKLTFTATANTSLGTRKAKVTVSAVGFPEPQIIKVTQDGTNAPLMVTAGNLSTVLSVGELASITKLTLTGTIDARDFKTMRDNMPMLAEVDLSGVSVVAYTGTGGTAGSGSITYPDNVIPEMAFSLDDWTGQTRIKSIVIPGTITSIGAKAFADCKGLTSLIIPPLVTTIGFDAFRNGWSFTSINIPPSVTYLMSAFRNFAGLINVDANNQDYSSTDGVLFNKNKTSLILCPTSKTGGYTIPSSVVSIETIAFSSCSQLTSIQIPPSVQSIYWYAFSNCNSLTSLNIPSSVTTIKDNTFEWCGALTSITVGWSTPLDLSTSPLVFRGVNKSTCTLYVPYGAKAAYQAANQWKDFTNIVEMPDPTTKNLSITAGGLSSALTAEELATVKNLTLSGTIDARDFKTMRDNMPLLAEVDLSGVTIAAYTGTEGTSIWENNNYLADAIPETAFINVNWQGKNTLTSIVFPSTMTSFEPYAFMNCNGLSVISIPPSVTTIGPYTFKSCQGMTSISIPPSVTTIENGAFNYCTGLINVDANNLYYSSIDGVLFNITQTKLIQCPISKAGSLAIPSSVVTIGQNAFSGCYQLNSITIPSSVSSIGDSAFSGCTGISSIFIPSSVATIESDAFSFCTALINVDANNLNYSSNSGILYNKAQTTLIQCPISKTGSLSIPATVVIIGRVSFDNCKALTSIEIPSSVKTIETYSFWHCGALTSIVVPSSVTEIGNGFFADCSNLKSITVSWPVPPDLSSISNVFYNVNKTTCILHVPYGTASRYRTAWTWQNFTNIIEAANDFNLSANTATLAATAGSTTTIDITGNVAWSVGSDQTWLTVSPTSGTGNQTLTFTAEANPSAGTRKAIVTVSVSGINSQTITVIQFGAANLNKIAFIYSSDLTEANSFKSLLEPIFSIDLIPVNGIQTTDFSTYELIITSNGTSLTTAQAQFLSNYNIPFICIGEGGYSTLGALSLRIGAPNGGHGNNNQIFVLDSNKSIFHIPNEIAIPSDNVLQLYYTTSHVAIYIPTPISNIELIGRDQGSSVHYSIVEQQNKYILWGFTNSPSDMTQTGKDLFINLINLSLNPEPYINLANTTININSIANSTSNVDVTTNVSWTANSDQTWLTVSPTTGTGNQTLTFTAEANPLATTRTATVTVSATGLESKTINITQSGASLAVTAGGLATALTAEQLATLTKLTLTGTIDARDFKTMRDNMPVLAELDLSGVTITEYTGTEGTWWIESKSITYPVNEIPGYAFQNEKSGKTTLTSVLLPVNATSIGYNAFNGAINLISIIIPPTITKIYDVAFAGCPFSAVTIPASVTWIGVIAFSGSNYINVEPDNPNYCSIDGVLFNKTKTILMQCPSSKTGTYTILPSVTKIDDHAFEYCRQLTSVNIPSSVTSISHFAFLACISLNSITIPSSVTYLGDWAFSDCTGLTSIYSHTLVPVDLSNSKDVFLNVNQTTCTLYVPFGTKGLYSAADHWKDFTNIIETLYITAGGLATILTAEQLASINKLTLTGIIDARDFKTMRDNMPLLAELDLSGATIVEYSGLEGTSGPGSITYPANAIPELAFSTLANVGKPSLISVSFPQSITSIGRNSFLNCTGLTSLAVPKTVTLIGRSAFNGCTGITSVTFESPSSLTTIGINAFRMCNKLTAITIPSTVTTIDNQGFILCSNLSSITFESPSSLTTIGTYAFGLCSKLTSFPISSIVTSIGNVAFLGTNIPVIVDAGNPNYTSFDGVLFDKNLTRLMYCPTSKTGSYNMPSTVKTVATDAFYGCSGLTSIAIPSGLTTLEDWAFEECTGLSSINLPSSVNSIGSYAFYNCTGLTSFFANPPIPVDLSAKTDVFYQVNKATCTLNVPYGSKSVYQTAKLWQDFANIVEMPSDSVYVTFRVDMRNEIVTAEGVHINGSWKSWGSASQLIYSSGFYFISLKQKKGEQIEYKFVNGADFDWGKYELLTGPCAYGDYKNRMLVVPEVDTILDLVCFGKCDACGALTGIKTINPVGGDFTSFTDAIAALNTFGVGQGGVTFMVAAGTIYNESGLIIFSTTSSASNPVVFQKDGMGSNPVIYGQKVGGSSMDPIIILFGSDYITFDGIDLASDPAATNDADKLEIGYAIYNNTLNGPDHLTIRNCTITIERKTNTDNQYGIYAYQNGGTSGSVISNLLIDNVKFIKGRTPVSVFAKTLPNENIEVRNCKFGETASIIEPLDYGYLITISNCRNLSFHHNEIQNIVSPDFYAFQTTNLIGENNIFNNKFHHLRSTSTIENSDIMVISSNSSDATATINYYNNLIFDVDGAKSSSTWADNPYWNLSYLWLNGNSKYRIYNNTVIGSSTNPHENTVLCWTPANSEIKNNIFADYSAVGPNTFRCIYLATCVNENNVLWIDESLTNNFTFRNTSKFREWQKGSAIPSPGYYLTNLSADPGFVDRANFDFNLKSSSPASNNGQPISFITTDFNGTSRNGSTPDIGAYEGDFGTAADLLPPVIRFQPLQNSSSGVVKLFAEITDNVKVANAKLWYRYKGSNINFLSLQGKQFGTVWEFTFPTLTSGTYEYFVCAKDVAGNVISNGYIVNGLDAALTGLTANNPVANPDYVYSFSVSTSPFAGSYTVGTGGNFNSLTNSGGLFEAINASLLDGNVNVTILSDLNESGQIALQQWQETGTGNYTLTIRPNDATLKTISNTTNKAISIMGADRITIDGSYNGDNLNHLKFVCDNAYTILFDGIDTKGCNNITLRYCNIDSNLYPAVVSVGGPNHSNFLIDHITSAKGIQGILLNNVNGTTISNCTIGSNNPSNSITGEGIRLNNCANNLIEKNTIRNIDGGSPNANGIILLSSTNSLVSANKIQTIVSRSGNGYGIQINNSSSIIVSNNMIADIDGVSAENAGIASNNSNNLKVFYNTVNMFSSTRGITYADAKPAGLYLNSTKLTSVSNNIFSVTFNNTSSALAVRLTSDIGSNTFGNNLYQRGGLPGNYFALNNNNFCSSFCEWQSSNPAYFGGIDMGSAEADPMFTNTTGNDGSLQSTSPALNSGIPVSVTTDFYGNARNATTPDMGAIEDNSLVLTNDQIAPVINCSPFPTSANTTPTFSATITDNVGVAASKLWYRIKGSTDAFASVDGIKQGDNKTWNFAITNPLTANSAYEYFICAKDAANNIITNGISNSVLDAATVGLTNNAPAANPAFVRNFKVAELSITLGTIAGTPFYVSDIQPVSFSIPYTLSGSFLGGNSITACLSDRNGNFASETAIGYISEFIGDFRSVGSRVHPTAGILPFDVVLPFTAVNVNTVHKAQIGDYTGYGLDITITDQTMLVDGQSVYKCNLQITGMPNPADQIVYTDYNGAPMNYYNPATKVFELYYGYNNAAPRKIRETNTRVNFVGLIGTINNSVPAGTGYKIRLKSSQPAGIISNVSPAFEIKKVDNNPPLVTLSSDNTSPIFAPFTLAIKFNEMVQGFAQNKISVTNANLSNFVATIPDREFTVLVSPINTGKVSVQVNASQVTDVAGNPNEASNIINPTYIQMDAPLLNISSLCLNDIITASPAKLIFIFDQDVTGFTSGDIGVTNGSIANFAADAAHPNSIFTADLIPISTGLVQIVVADDVANGSTSLIGNTAASLSLMNTALPNYAPLANAGIDQSVNEGTVVTLDGSASSDQDANLLTYLWTPPAGITLSSTTVAKPTFTAPEVNVNTDYTFSLVVNDGTVNSTADQVVVSVLNVDQVEHFQIVWTGNGTDHMNIDASSAKIEGVDLEAGDEIGIFDGIKCLGAGLVTKTINSSDLLQMVVSRDDGSGNGYISGNSISYRIYDKSQDKELSAVNAVYSSTDPLWNTTGQFAAGTTSVVELNGMTKITQSISLNTGWNIISANVVPDNKDMKSIFQPLIDAGKLKKVMDEAGKTIENFGVLGGWKNNIGSLTVSKGYKVNVTSSCSLSLEGVPVTLPLNINLAAGWNIISYPSASAQDAKALFQSLIDAGKLKKVMDEAGKTIENFGVLGGWKNNIGNLNPNKGYKVNVTAACTITIPANGGKSAIVLPELLASTHFQKSYQGNGTDHANIHLMNLQSSGLKAGDEIGVFDGKLCVGSATIGIDQMMNGYISLPASANDELTASANGFTNGHPAILKLFRDNREYLLTPELLNNSANSFAKGESLFAKVSFDQATGLSELTSQTSVKCYPNPFTEQITIEIQSGNSEKLEVRIFDINGKLVRNLYKGEADGKTTMVWDGKNDNGAKAIPGTYLINANGKIEKVVLKD